jgi:uncharacterized protein
MDSERIPINNIKGQSLKKMIFFILGTISLVLAYIGTIMPGIPGTPFILLTAYFYIRSSDRMYNWILRNRLFNKIIQEFRKGENIPMRFKLIVVVNLWISIAVAEIWLIENIWYRAGTILIGFLCSIFVIRMKRKKNEIMNLKENNSV